MPQTQPVGLAQKKSDYTLLALGTAALVLGFYVGFARPSDTVLVFALLGGSVVLFVAALSRLLKRLGYRVVIVSSAEVRPAASAVTRPVAKREIRPNSTGSVADLMNTRLGDLFGADRIDDPEAAGRIVVQAIIRAQAPIATAKTNDPAAERQPETKTINKEPHNLSAVVSSVDSAGSDSAALAKLKNV